MGKRRCTDNLKMMQDYRTIMQDAQNFIDVAAVTSEAIPNTAPDLRARLYKLYVTVEGMENEADRRALFAG